MKDELLKDWQIRIVKEKIILDSRIKRAEKFMSECNTKEIRKEKGIDPTDFFLVGAQLNFMKCYSRILQIRIERFQ